MSETQTPETPQRVPMYEITNLINAELKRAETKFPNFTSSIPMAGLVIGEEVGELQQAIVKYYDEAGDFERIIPEAIQVIVTGIRLVQNIHILNAKK